MWPAKPDDETSVLQQMPIPWEKVLLEAWPQSSSQGRQKRGRGKLRSPQARAETRPLVLPLLGESLELSYTSPVMMLCQVLEPSSHSASGLKQYPFLPPRAAALGRL